jgi:hypothetical protein
MLVVDVVKTIDEDLKSIIAELEKIQKELLEEGESPQEMILVLNKVTHLLFILSFIFFLCFFLVLIGIEMIRKRMSQCRVEDLSFLCFLSIVYRLSWIWQRKTEMKRVLSNVSNITFQIFINSSLKCFSFLR